jgi:lipid II isoglutaminyl synthase (glutamine-hydrolysing)
MNIYGDRGNIITLSRRAAWRGLDVITRPLGLGEKLDPDWADFYFIGGGQDKQQEVIAEDLRGQSQLLIRALESRAVILSVCGGYQLLGHYYRPHQGPELKGLSILDAYTVAGDRRMIGNVTLKTRDGNSLVGFENHSGKTYLGKELNALGRVVVGNGNNGEDGWEGAHSGTVYGTYLHGSLLPKNPWLADRLIQQALSRRYSDVVLAPLADAFEQRAHDRALELSA